LEKLHPNPVQDTSNLVFRDFHETFQENFFQFLKLINYLTLEFEPFFLQNKKIQNFSSRKFVKNSSNLRKCKLLNFKKIKNSS
jgi:hypothetical protein